jgi:hypothetical protein
MDIEKTIQFLLDQQARSDARQTRMEEDLSRITGVLLDIATAQERSNQIVVVLAERQAEMAESLKTLTDAQKVTQANLNAVVSMVERHISQHNHKENGRT